MVGFLEGNRYSLVFMEFLGLGGWVLEKRVDCEFNLESVLWGLVRCVDGWDFLLIVLES